MRMEQEQVMYWMRADKKASGVRANDSVRESVLTEWEKSCNDVRIIVYLSSSIIIWAAGAALHRRGRCADLLCGIEWSSWHYVLWTLQYLYSLWICTVVINDKCEEKMNSIHQLLIWWCCWTNKLLFLHHCSSFLIQFIHFHAHYHKLELHYPSCQPQFN